MEIRSLAKLVAAGCLSMYSCLLAAQNKLDSLQHLDEVVIVARPYKEVIPVQRLSGLQLERLNTHSVADALRYFSGVQIKDYGGMGGLKTVDVRNMGTHHVGVFYDGIEVGNAQNGVVDLGRYSLDDLEELTLYNGQKSDVFQSAKDFASASAVYLKAKKPAFKEGERTNLLVRYKASTIQLINPSFRWEQKVTERVNVSLSGEFTKSDGQYNFRYRRLNRDGTVAYDTTATRWNSDIEAYRIEAGVYGTLTKGYWQAKLYYYDSHRGLPGAIVKNVWHSGERQGDKNFFAQGTYVKEVNPRYKWQINAKFAYDLTDYFSRDTTLLLGQNVTKSMQIDNSYYQQDWYLSMVHSVALLPVWEVSLSTDFQYNKLNGVTRGVDIPFSFPQRYTAWASLATALHLGRFKAQASLLATFVTDRVRNNYQAPDKSELSPALFFSYRPFARHGLNLRAFYKRIFRMPTFNDLYYAQIGSSQLRPEYSHQFNIGASYEKRVQQGFIDRLAVQADAYYANITDKIIASPTSSQFRWMMTNMGRVKSRGIDASASINGHVDKVKWNIGLTYGYARAQDFSTIDGKPMSSYGDQIPYTPWHSGSATAGMEYRTWRLNYSFLYVGERYNGAVNNEPRNRVEPWYTHDLSVQKEFLVSNRYLFKASVEVNNVFNQYYDVVLNYPMPGRNFRFILSLSL